jgi:hypothetical protein
MDGDPTKENEIAWWFLNFLGGEGTFAKVQIMLATDFNVWIE